MAADKISFTHAGKTCTLTRGQVIQTMRGVSPEAMRTHWVEIDGIQFPVKQVFAKATKLDRLDFATNQARNQLRRLGFVVGRIDDQIIDDWDALVERSEKPQR